MSLLRLIALALTLSLSLSFVAACGSTSSPSTTSLSPPSSSSSTSPSSSSTTATEEQTQATIPHGTPEKAAIKIGLPADSVTYLPMYTAHLRDFFKEQGVDATIVVFSGGSALTQALVGGSVDIAAGALVNVINAIDQGAKVKVFYGGFNMPEFNWYGKNVASFKEAKGKTFGVSKYGSSTDFATRYMLVVNGLDPEKDVKILQAGADAAMFAALESGQLDVAILAPSQWYNAVASGYTLVGSMTDLAPDYPDHVWSATESFIASNPETIRAVLRGFAKAVELNKADKAAALEDLMTQLKFTEELASKTYDDSIEYSYADGQLPSQKGMESFWAMGVKTGQFKEVWPNDKWLDSTFLESYSEWK